MRFSIIMPVYNAGKYLRTAIDSVLNQSFGEFELILVDDGSSDGSAEICESYATKDDRVVFVKQQNTGVSHARNVGMKLAGGEYVGFCDHDDEYLPGFLETIDSAFRMHPQKVFDFVKVNHETYDRGPDGQAKLMHLNYACSEGMWDREHSKDSLFRNFIGTVWDGFYRRSFLAAGELRFDESFKFGGEDFLFNLMVMSRVKYAWHCGTVPYYRHYLNRGMSTSSKCHPELIDCYFKAINYELQHFVAPVSNIGHRYNFWKGNFLSYVFLGAGNKVSLYQASKTMSQVSRLLLPSDKVMQTELALSIRLLACARMFLLLGLLVLVKGWASHRG